MSEPLPRAVVDVGTNTIRLLIGSVVDGRVRRQVMERSVTRLGASLAQTGALSSRNIDKSIETLTAFKSLCEVKGAEDILVIGTSALREASDSDSFISRVEVRTGLRIRVISGDEEAALTLKGVAGSPGNRALHSAARLIIDIGGGSTEWILAAGALAKGSIPVGVVKLSETFIHRDPPSPAELHLLKDHLLVALSPLVCARDRLLKDWGPANNSRTEMILTGGTPTTLAAVDLRLTSYDGEKVHLHPLALSSLERMFRTFSTLTARERSGILGMEPERVDLIVAGTVLVMTLMDLMETDVATVSDYGLLEGALLKLFDGHYSRA